MNTFYVINLSKDSRQLFSPDVSPIVSSHKVFCGSAQHYERVRMSLPEDSVWVNIEIPYSGTFDVLEQYYTTEDIVLLINGDPSYFGFTSSLYKQFPEASFQMYSSHNKLHKLAHHLMMPYNDMYMADFSQQNWQNFDFALLKGKPKIGVNTTRVYSPSAIAERMMEYGYNNYFMFVGEHLDNPEKRNVRKMTLASASSAYFDLSNCIILVKEFENPTQLYGIPDHYFSRVQGETLKITPMPIRLMALSLLELKTKRVLWDIGFCTGSVAIEARLQFPHLQIVGFDLEEECANLLAVNSCRCGTPGIRSIISDFCEADLMLLDQPDAIFIGGHGGKLIEIIGRITEIVEPGCVVVFCSLNEESNVFFHHAATMFPIQVMEETRITIDSYNTNTVFKAVVI